VLAIALGVRIVRSGRIALPSLVPLAGLAGVATAGLYTPLVDHLSAQVTFSARKVDWWVFFQAFFRGRDGVNGEPLAFAADFTAGLFGLYFATPDAGASMLTAAVRRITIVVTVAALIAAVGLLSCGGRTLQAEDEDTVAGNRGLLAAWVGTWVMLWLPALYLAQDGNYWPAGKAISYAAPVFMMLLVLPAACPFRPPALRPLRWIAGGFAAFQLLSGVTRIAAAAEPSGIHYAAPYPAIQAPALKTDIGWDLTGLKRVLSRGDRVLIMPMHTQQEHQLMVFLWSRRIPFAAVTEVTTRFGAGQKLGALPPPWPPDVEISATGHALTVRFRDGRERRVATAENTR
jgi:hypothetical protein